MLADDELKLLRVLWNLNRNEWAKPEMGLLTRYSGRSRQRVRVAIEEDRGYLRVIKDSEISIKNLTKFRYWID
jgi:hypothetical protein